MNRRTLYPWAVWCVWVLVIPLGLVLATGAVVSLTKVGDVPFDNPDLVWLLGLVPLAGLSVAYGLARRRRALSRFASADLAPLLASPINPHRQAARAGLRVLAVAALIAAIIGPRWGMYLHKQKVRGVDIVVALDVSRSMLADDLKPNRFERAKQEVRQQLLDRPQFAGTHRMALLAFAGSTSLKVPLTTDRLSFRSKLDLLNVGSAPRGGTAVGKAIQAAYDLFVKSPEEAAKIILLVTDGEDHEGAAVDIAKEVFRERNIRVYTVGVGDPASSAGAQVPAADGAKAMVHDGQLVYSKVNVPLLRQIAEAAGGEYAPVEDLPMLVNQIASMRKAELSTEERMRHKPRYQWFVVLALFCLGLETTIRERRMSREGPPQRMWQEEAVA